MTKNSESVKQLVEAALEDMKGKNIICLDVKLISSFADYMLVVTKAYLGIKHRQIIGE